jgi:hypothetical protein
VNEAWQAAGFAGTISPTLVKTVRASMGLTKNTKKSKTSATVKKPGTPRKASIAPVNVQPRASADVLNDLEVDIDRLIFKVMGIGDLTEIEDTLRQARRLVYGALTRA